MIESKGKRPPGSGKGQGCAVCKRRFVAHPRTGDRQKTCGDPSCRWAHRAAYRRGYRKTNAEAEAGYEAKRRSGRETDYWRQYRESHPESTRRNRAQSRLRKRLLKAGLQRQLDIVQLSNPIENFDRVKAFATSHRSLLEECLPKKAG